MLEADVKVVDEETGEVKSVKLREVIPRGSKPRDKDFFRMRPEALRKLIATDLSGADYKVLLTLCYMCNWTNRVEVIKSDVAAVTGLSAKAVYNSLTKLHLLHFVHFPNGTTRGACFIDPEICWRGYTDNLPAAITQYSRTWSEYLAALSIQA